MVHLQWKSLEFRILKDKILMWRPVDLMQRFFISRGPKEIIRFLIFVFEECHSKWRFYIFKKKTRRVMKTDLSLEVSVSYNFIESVDPFILIASGVTVRVSFSLMLRSPAKLSSLKPPEKRCLACFWFADEDALESR